LAEVLERERRSGERSRCRRLQVRSRQICEGAWERVWKRRCRMS
jgi:hypothetical protein